MKYILGTVVLFVFSCTLNVEAHPNVARLEITGNGKYKDQIKFITSFNVDSIRLPDNFEVTYYYICKEPELIIKFDFNTNNTAWRNVLITLGNDTIFHHYGKEYNIRVDMINMKATRL